MTPEERRIYRARMGYDNEDDDYTLLWGIARPAVLLVGLLILFIIGVVVMAV